MDGLSITEGFQESDEFDKTGNNGKNARPDEILQRQYLRRMI